MMAELSEVHIPKRVFEQELRMRCMEAAVRLCASHPSDINDAADRMYRWVTDEETEPDMAALRDATAELRKLSAFIDAEMGGMRYEGSAADNAIELMRTMKVRINQLTTS